MTRPHRPLALLLIALLLAACSETAAPPTATSPPAPSAVASAPPAATVAGTAAPTGTPRPVGSPVASSAGTPAANPPTPTPNFAGLPQTSPAAGEALVEQAIGFLLGNYVDQLDSAALYGAAYEGVRRTLIAFGKPAQGQAPALGGDAKQNAATFKVAYVALAGGAGADLNQTGLAYEAIRAVTASIDECHTAFLDPAQFRSVTAGLSGNNTYGGIGVTIRTQTRPVTIGGIFPDTPAARSGLRTGDAIIAVDGTDVSDLPADAISPLVRGQEGTQVRLTVAREGEPGPLEFTITRAQIKVPIFVAEPYKAPSGATIGYMKLYSFSTDADGQIKQALVDFERQGVVGWVLDLRDNGGGYIDVLSRITSLFVKKGEPVAYRIVRGGGAEPIATDPALAFSPQRPLAILINGGSASSSEALASSAADNGFARLFGQKTAGCLAGATNYTLADGSAIQVTIWKIVSPQRREINRLGQRPDEEIAPDPTGKADPVLDAALAWVASQPPTR